MNYEILSEQINAEYGTAVRILKFGPAKFHVCYRDEDSGKMIGVVIYKTLTSAQEYAAKLVSLSSL